MDRLDEIDLGILHLLQTDARKQTPVDMAEELPVSDQTIRNRIQKLEDQGIIDKYIPVVDYERAGFPIRLQFTCTAPVLEREDLAQKALQISHVVNVQEMLSANDNIRVLAVTNDSEKINQVASDLVDLGLTIEREQLQRGEYTRPFNHFGEDKLSKE
ncbi:Lrp/AsnC family transcriptional regulator [Haloprofundus salilacus]|uniref:Lrp/AsnC family transcriptional regulator n=1 Tax=Haloprofundus salilacus TaxID=2876190 RepID=UPI001CCF5272|nr:AsnC family transcriptional regulator [Haloprofundus salilacus]